MNCIKELRQRITPGDFVICFWGIGHYKIVEELKDLPVHVLGPVFLN